MSRPAEPAPRRDEIDRFDRVERWVHGSVGVLFAACALTAAVLYLGPLSVLVGNRRIVVLVHVWSGFALPVPLVAGAVSKAYRSDLRRLGRFTPADGAWLRAGRGRRSADGVGKFNAGQKLNGALSTGAVLVLLGTGTIMYFTGLAPLAYRTGATFVHDWSALAVGILVLGHLHHALRDPEAMRGIRSGRVHRAWARNEHPEWERETRDARRPRHP
jgi:formate dehydrogenase subunit gamma